jgi:hypothetical protein
VCESEALVVTEPFHCSCCHLPRPACALGDASLPFDTEYGGRDLVSLGCSVSPALLAFGATFPLRGAERPSALAAARNVSRCCACTIATCPVSKGVGHDLYLLS